MDLKHGWEGSILIFVYSAFGYGSLCFFNKITVHIFKIRNGYESDISKWIWFKNIEKICLFKVVDLTMSIYFAQNKSLTNQKCIW